MSKTISLKDLDAIMDHLYTTYYMLDMNIMQIKKLEDLPEKKYQSIRRQVIKGLEILFELEIIYKQMPEMFTSMIKKIIARKEKQTIPIFGLKDMQQVGGMKPEVLSLGELEKYFKDLAEAFSIQKIEVEAEKVEKYQDFSENELMMAEIWEEAGLTEDQINEAVSEYREEDRIRGEDYPDDLEINFFTRPSQHDVDPDTYIFNVKSASLADIILLIKNNKYNYCEINTDIYKDDTELGQSLVYSSENSQVELCIPKRENKKINLMKLEGTLSRALGWEKPPLKNPETPRRIIFNNILHPELVLDRRGPDKIRASLSKMVNNDFIKEIADAVASGDKKYAPLFVQLQALLNFKKDKNRKVYRVGKDFGEAMLQVTKEIPVEKLPFIFNSFISVPDNLLYLDDIPVAGAYIFIEKETSEKSLWIALVLGHSSRPENYELMTSITALDEYFYNRLKMPCELLGETATSINTDKINEIFKFFINIVLYINSSEPDLEDLRPRGHLTHSQRAEIKSNINLATVPIIAINWNFQHQRIYSMAEGPRRGHFHWVLWGPGKSKIKLNWFDPIIVRYKHHITDEPEE